jgi:hypothetical protein
MGDAKKTKQVNPRSAWPTFLLEAHGPSIRLFQNHDHPREEDLVKTSPVVSCPGLFLQVIRNHSRSHSF